MVGSMHVNGLRASQAWKQETKDEIDLGNTLSRCTATWRNSSTAVKDYTSEQVITDARHVSSAIKVKLGQTATLRDQLDAVLRQVSSEMAALVNHRTKIEERVLTINKKADINASRGQVRNGRPIRERTMDDVERDLQAQSGELVAFGQRCQRSIAQINKALADLDTCRQRLEADLRDKQHALEVDTAVLHIPVDGARQTANAHAATLRRPAGSLGAHDGMPGRTPQTWQRMTSENVYFANKTLADCVRLRKAINIAMANSREKDHKLAASLDRSMQAKLTGIQSLRRQVASQLEAVRQEQASMQSQRNALAVALEAKLGPLEQAQARLRLRRERTDRETVADQVEAALIKEIQHLNSAIQSLTAQVAAADKHLDRMANTIYLLEGNLADKDANMRVDETAIMLDGRVETMVRPPSSAASFGMRSVSTARAATMRRIADLEGQLGRAHNMRMTNNIYSYRATAMRPGQLQDRPRTSGF